jgi:hypothetical protein
MCPYNQVKKVLGHLCWAGLTTSNSLDVAEAGLYMKFFCFHNKVVEHSYKRPLVMFRNNSITESRPSFHSGLRVIEDHTVRGQLT